MKIEINDNSFGNIKEEEEEKDFPFYFCESLNKVLFTVGLFKDDN